MVRMNKSINKDNIDLHLTIENKTTNAVKVCSNSSRFCFWGPLSQTLTNQKFNLNKIEILVENLGKCE